MPPPDETLAHLRQLLASDLPRVRAQLGTLTRCHLLMSFSNHYWEYTDGKPSRDWKLVEWVEFVSEHHHDTLFARFYAHLLAESWLAGKNFREMGCKRLEDALGWAQPYAITSAPTPPLSRRERAWNRVRARLTKRRYTPLFAWQWDLSGQGEGMQLGALAIKPLARPA